MTINKNTVLILVYIALNCFLLVTRSASEVMEAPNEAAILEEAKVSSLTKILSADFEEDSAHEFNVYFTRRSASTITYKGVTSEAAHSGNRCYKIELTMAAGDTGGTVYFLLPFEAPVWSDLKLSMYVRVQAELNNPEIAMYCYHGFSTGDAEAGTNHGANKGVLEKEEDGWQHWVATLSGGNSISQYVDGPALRLSLKGKHPETKITIYVDDVVIEGRLPSTWRAKWARVQHYYKEEFDAHKRKQAALRMKGIQDWSRDLERTQSRLSPRMGTGNSIVRDNYSYLLKEIREDAAKYPPMVNEIIRQLRDKSKPFSVDLVDLERCLIRLRYNLSLAEAYASYANQYLESDYATFILDPTMSYPILPTGPTAHTWEASFYDYAQKGEGFENPQVLSNSVIVPGVPGRRLCGFGCRGTFVPYSFVIATAIDLGKVEFEVTPLVSNAGDTVAPDAVDIRVVAPWYRPFGGKARLMNEMLLHDAGFVVPDQETSSNIFKDAKFGSDACRIVPLDISAGSSRQFYLTVRIPADARAGLYKGLVKAKASGCTEISWPLEIEVLPFDLDPTPYAYSAYYRSYIVDPENKRAIGNHSWFKTEEQMRKELAGMAEHGLNVYNYYNSISSFDLSGLGKYLSMATEAGLTRSPWIWIGPPIPYRTTEALPTREQVFEDIDTKVGQLVAYCRQSGYPRPAVYGYDEISGDKLLKVKEFYSRINQAGGLVAAACYPDYYDEAGSAISVPIVFGGAHSSRARAAMEKTKADGNEFWIYNCPVSCMPASPSVYRRRYGLAMWRNGEQGAIPWEYSGASQHRDSPAYDFDWQNELAAFAYPTMDGKPIDTVIYEAFREGIYDTRYMATLERYVKQAGKENACPELVEEIRKYLEQLSVQGDLQEIRRQLADYIVALQESLRPKRDK